MSISDTLYHEMQRIAAECRIEEADVDFFAQRAGDRLSITRKCSIGSSDRWVANVGLVTLFLRDDGNWIVEWNNPHHPTDIAYHATVGGYDFRPNLNVVEGKIADPDSIPRMIAAIHRALDEWACHIDTAPAWASSRSRK